MTIQVGERLPDVKFKLATEEGPVDKNTADLFKNKRAILFAVPGAFTPTCHKNHLPGYLKLSAALKSKGIDKIYVVAVNDPFVMQAWKGACGVMDEIEFLADGSAEFTKAVGLTLDANAFGMGLRSKRYSMIVSDGIVEALNVEDTPVTADKSGAEVLLANL